MLTVLSDTALAAYQHGERPASSGTMRQQEDVMSVAAQAESNNRGPRKPPSEQEQQQPHRAASVRAALNRVTMAVETGAVHDALSDIGELMPSCT
jgi:hypothetical protein